MGIFCLLKLFAFFPKKLTMEAYMIINNSKRKKEKGKKP